MRTYYAIGAMSGTSLDGLDLALCKITRNVNNWSFQIIDAVTYSYNKNWQLNLKLAHEMSGYQLVNLHRKYGKYIGEKIRYFLKYQNIKPDLIASHGHTIFHEPGENINFQLGEGAAIAAITNITTVSDFRSLDINLGGQGAPLVPLGDLLLFGDYDFCINLGGFANISYHTNSHERIAFDICPVNILLNQLAQKEGKAFDVDGQLGRNGNINERLLFKLDALPFYNLAPPKSLGREWVKNEIDPLLDNCKIANQDKMATLYEHISSQITSCLNGNKVLYNNVLLTGGGALNSYLVEQIKLKTEVNIIVPDKKLIQYKEALIFALLGILRIENKPNCLKSVTGASTNNIGGQVQLMNNVPD